MPQDQCDVTTNRVGELFRRKSMEEFQREVVVSEIPHVDITLKLEIRKGKISRLVRVIEAGEVINLGD